MERNPTPQNGGKSKRKGKEWFLPSEKSSEGREEDHKVEKGAKIMKGDQPNAVKEDQEIEKGHEKKKEAKQLIEAGEERCGHV